MADVKSLEHPTLKVPYEILNKKFRTAQKTLDREVSHVQQTASLIEVSLNTPDVRAKDISSLLGGMVEKLQVLKRKAEESISEELAASTVCKRRLEHLKEHNTLTPSGTVSQGALNQWRRKRLDRMVVEYFLRNGYYNAAITLAGRSDIKDLTNIDIFLTSREVEKSLANRETSKCLIWCHDNKSKLRKLKSNMEFNLRIQEFVELIRSDRRIEAIKHARKHFPSFEDEHLGTIQQVMALLAFSVNTVIVPYKNLFDEKRWDTLIEQFRQENYRLFQLASQSVFTVALQAGLSALKTPQCYSENCENRNPSCPVCQPYLNELAEALPFAHCSQSRLYCNISGLPMNENNQPMMLPNGHIYGEQEPDMSSAQVLDPLPPKPASGGGNPNKPPPKPLHTNNNNNNSKRKNKHGGGGRKRSKSFSAGGAGLMICQKPVLPSKFLLGGNIKDPLNLNSLQDEEINRAMNAVTPKSSPVPTPPRKKFQIEVIIPRNIHDPLNLTDCADDAEYEQQLSSSIKKSKKKRLKKRRTISGTMDTTADSVDLITEAKTPETATDSAKIPDAPPPDLATPPDARAEAVLEPATPTAKEGQKATGKRKAPPKPRAVQELALELATPSKAPPTAKKEGQKVGGKRKSDEYGHSAKKFKNSGMDKIVSPVVPQPGAWPKRSALLGMNKRAKPRQNKPEGVGKEPQFKEKDKRFQYGNYNRYYGYRNPNNEIDHRLRVFSHHPYLFDNKDVLDIGCNIGHITHSVARDFRAKTVLGIDIDPKLIAIARKNIRHYVKTSEGSPIMGEEGLQTGSKKSSEFFPISMPILYGAIDVPGYHDRVSERGSGFPNNVTFKHCNYILEDDNLIALEQPQFDVILCLSITKWIHLNWGDAGMRQAFRRMYAQLRPGGKLVLEPQNWAGYKSKKKLTDTIYKNYSSIEFFPDKFREYLLSPAVGFAKGEILGYPAHQAKGFRRPVQVFTKSTMFPSERVEATPSEATPSVVSSLDSSACKTEKYESQNSVSHVYTNIIDDSFCAVSDDNADVIDKIDDVSKPRRRPTISERTTASEEGEGEEFRSGEGHVEGDSEMSEVVERDSAPEAGDNT
ncbi:unnamed protein product [Phaedon cochleariae]|uniref:E3 ubiquitin-protein transferase MAEA n=1 Tax=Phaedon cochleariae TaxID=80249 RepID=A0A9P0DIP5_PHACE|nr:unnamed protein product [Phaedon cochleariae]